MGKLVQVQVGLGKQLADGGCSFCSEDGKKGTVVITAKSELSGVNVRLCLSCAKKFRIEARRHEAFTKRTKL